MTVFICSVSWTPGVHVASQRSELIFAVKLRSFKASSLCLTMPNMSCWRNGRHCAEVGNSFRAAALGFELSSVSRSLLGGL